MIVHGSKFDFLRQKCTNIRSKIACKMAWLNFAAKTLQDASKTLTRRPKKRSDLPQDVPQTAQDASRTPPRRPKTNPSRSKTPPRWPQDAPKTPPKRSKTPPGVENKGLNLGWKDDFQRNPLQTSILDGLGLDFGKFWD